MLDTRMIATAGGALAAGAGLQWYKDQGQAKINIKPLLMDLIVGALGIFGATQLTDIPGDIVSGLALGAVAHAGAELYEEYKSTGAPQQYRVGGYPTYSYPVYPTHSVGAVNTLEI